MIDINIQNNQAQIKIDGQVPVFVSLDPLPAEKIQFGYTHLAWIWCAVNNTLEAANVDLSFADTRRIAGQISEKLLRTASTSTAELAFVVFPFTEVE